MNNIQEILLFPVRDAEARKQFLFACLIVLVGFIIPILPTLVLTGYSVKIMRQVMEERKNPSMPDMGSSDWSEMLIDGLRLWGTQIVMALPLLLVMGCALVSIMGGGIWMAIASEENVDALAAVGILFFFLGFGIMMLFSVLSLPYGVIITAAGPHVVTKRSFAAAFQFKDWWEVFRNGLAQFLLSYVILMVLSFVFVFVMQFAMLTIVLICLVPFILVPFTAYFTLVTNTLYAQAYLAGKDALEASQHAAA